MEGLKDLSLFELQLLVDVADLSSLRAAARTRGLTASHASKVLLRAERKLGFRLFSRSASGVTTTREGLDLLDGVREVLKAAEALTSATHEAGHDHVISVGSVSFLNHALIAPHVGELAALSDRLRFRLLDLAPDQLISTGIRGAVDVTVHAGRLEWPETWSQTALGPMRWMLIARVGHPLGRKVAPAALTDYAFVVPTYWRGDGFAIGNDFCPLPWSSRRKGHEVSTAGGAVAIVTHTDQLAFVPEVVARGGLSRGELDEIDVRGWGEFAMPIFLTVKADIVQARLAKRLAASLSARLAG